jgi:hypothetical protein
MTYVDNGHFARGGPLRSGRAYDVMNRLIDGLQRAGQSPHLHVNHQGASSLRTPLEQRLVDFQSSISDVSRYLPTGFAVGLNRQFANMFDDDAWEDGDDLPTVAALTGFLTMLIQTRSNRRPGIGTNGRGSITAFWTEGVNRLTVECYAAGRTTWVLTRIQQDGGVERAAGDCQASRLLDVLQPYEQGVWFGQ